MVRLADSMYPSSPLKWLYVDFNSYFASVEQQLQPALRGKPVAVVPVETDSTCAIAASYEAKAFGVKTGTPIWEARQKCPGLICVLARHEAYVDYHHRAIAEINRHIPVSAVCSIDEMACALMRNEASPDVARRIGIDIKAGLANSLGPWVRCSIGVAENRYLAKVATDLEKPDGFTILMPDEVKGRLMALDLRDLPGIGRNMERRLQMAGIASMADLWALDRRNMRSVWGSIWGERMWYLLRGYDLPELETKRRSLGHSHVLGPALRPPHLAIDVARRLTMKACSRLRRMEYYATVFGFSARLEDGRRIHAEQRCRPAQDSMTFLDMLLVFWEQMIPKDRGVQVKKLSVVLHGLVQQDLVQPDLFDVFDPEPLVCKKKRDPARMNGLSHALDRINHRFGRDSALIGMLPSQGRSFSGTKIAFTRIPDIEEFLE
jgi:DNA polymerase IV